MMTLGSLFSGSGTAELCAEMLGIEPLWSAEIEPYPCKVLAYNFPEVPNLGDIKEIDGSRIPPVDMIVYGSPCQNLSISGKREGLNGEHSRLFYEAIRIIREMRDATNGRYPRYTLFENVAGALTSSKCEDFKTILEEFTEAALPRPKNGKWERAGCIMANGRSVAWRVLDASGWGVPQRRRRVFIVCDFRGWGAPKILFESCGLRRNYKTCGRTWKHAPFLTPESSGESDEKSQTCFIPVENHPCDSRVTLYEPETPIQTLSARMGTGGGNVPLILECRWGDENDSH